MAIIYLEVAKRMGIACELVSAVDDEIFLRWKEFPGYDFFLVFTTKCLKVRIYICILDHLYFRRGDDVGYNYIDAANIHRQINCQTVFTPLNNPLQVIECMGKGIMKVLKHLPSQDHEDKTHGYRRFLHMLRLPFVMKLLPNDRVGFGALLYATICSNLEIQLEEAMQLIDQVVTAFTIWKDSLS